jgi:hypothetical protein
VRQAETPAAFASALKDAITISPSSKDLESVQKWLSNRRNHFLQDVEVALSNFL